MKKLSLALAAMGLVAAVGAHAGVSTDLLGDPASPAEATRTVVITPDTQYVNVNEGDIVKFTGGARDFAYNFDSMRSESFDLRQVAPAGALDHAVTAYVNYESDVTGTGSGSGRIHHHASSR